MEKDVEAPRTQFQNQSHAPALTQAILKSTFEGRGYLPRLRHKHVDLQPRLKGCLVKAVNGLERFDMHLFIKMGQPSLHMHVMYMCK